jgi:hypothetical protein
MLTEVHVMKREDNSLKKYPILNIFKELNLTD